ncbi:MAG: hypothetical protein MK135_01760 [Polyangiaceae bacterium]|nr:hypothetical protein [Polyangiaceae bacterium]
MSRGALPKKAAQALSGYLKQHPEEILRAAKNATQLKMGVPLAALRWVLKEVLGNKVPEDLELTARNPGLHAAASLDLMKTPIRASATVLVERIDLREDALLVDIRLNDIEMEVTDPSSGTPIAALLQSGALDLSRPGDLLSYLPQTPEFLIGAEENRLSFDLMRHPKLSAELAKKLVQVLVPLVGVQAIQTEGEHLEIAFSALPKGASGAIDTLKKIF